MKSPEKAKLEVQCVLILGKGRSGTTWLGHLLNAYEHCIYKYEPFLPRKNSPYYKWLQNLPNYDIDEMRQRFYELCKQSFLETDLPPFLPKSFRHKPKFLLWLLYHLAKRQNFFRTLYESFSRPVWNNKISILIKDVNFPNENLSSLCKVITPDIIAILRNPLANISSFLEGIKIGVFSPPNKRDFEKVSELIARHQVTSLQKYQNQWQQIPLATFEAVRWRIQNEPLVRFIENYEKGKLIIYEDFCKNPRQEVENLFEFLNWQLTPNIYKYLNSTEDRKKIKKMNKKKEFFSIQRNSTQVLDKWKVKLSKEEQKQIIDVVNQSPLCKLWPDMFV